MIERARRAAWLARGVPVAIEVTVPTCRRTLVRLGRRWVRGTKAKLIEVALGVGYESEAACSRAFKRAVGVAPGAWRAGRRPGGGGEGVSP